LFVIDGEVVASMKRQAKNEDEFRANLGKGGSGLKYVPTDLEIDYALKSATATGQIVTGVDMMHTVDGPVVIEVNSNPGLKIEKISGVNLAGKIADLAIRNAANFEGYPDTIYKPVDPTLFD
jgi:ribosomal protein S6--L-glutamate ligase